MARRRRRNSEPRDFRSEAKQVVALAGKGRSGSARVIRGAINDVYDRQAEDLLRKTADRAADLGMTPAQQRAEVAEYLRLMAAEATLRHHRRRR